LALGSVNLAQGDFDVRISISSSLHLEGSLEFQKSAAANIRGARARVTPDASAPLRKRRRPNSPAKESKLRRKSICLC
jgi:hypothetical protein